MLTATVLFLALAQLAMARPPFEQSRAPSYYYDGGSCNGAGSQDHAPPSCSLGLKTYGDYATQRIVAIDVSLFSTTEQKADWCGREVQMFVNGEQVTHPEGPWILYDACGDCEQKSRIDVSGSGHEILASKAGGQACGMADPVTVKVLDNDLTYLLEGGDPSYTWAQRNWDGRYPHNKGNYPADLGGYKGAPVGPAPHSRKKGSGNKGSGGADKIGDGDAKKH